jgi:DNA-directed RNA polymerase subunit beta'
VTIEASEKLLTPYFFPDSSFKSLVKKSDKVEEKSVLAKSSNQKTKLLSDRAGTVEKIDKSAIYIRDLEPQRTHYTFDAGRTILVKVDDKVRVGDKITEGHINIHSLMDLAGPLKTQLYIVNDIKEIYSSQGQTVNSKHIELIVRQMFSKIKITNAGDSSFFPGDIIDIIRFKKENRKLDEQGLKQAIGIQLLLGLTKTSLYTESWLSAASFQETVRTLVEASTARKIDLLEGLKENVIIGRLIPTLKYFNNNQNVGEYFDAQSEETEGLLAANEIVRGMIEATDDESISVESMEAVESREVAESIEE